MKKLLIKNVLVGGHTNDILVADGVISRIAESIEETGCDLLDGHGMTAMPGFVNMHTHSSMTLMRGAREDMPLAVWLPEIWRIEARINEEFVYWGSKLAALEMLKSGTTTFMDMYFKADEARQAFTELGLRGFYTCVLINTFDPKEAERQKKECEEMYERSLSWDPTSKFAVTVHADYTVDRETLLWGKDFALSHGLKFHFHANETEDEVKRGFEKYGMSPIQYLDSLNLLDKDAVAAHCLWLDETDIRILADRKVNVVHNINSNLKISSGYRFLYEELRDAGVNVCLGTDGAATNNNLDMLESMKIAALLQKAWRGRPDALPLGELLDMATVNGAKALEINAGVLKEGALADIILINTNMSCFVPDVNFLANFVYAAHSDCIDTVICNGRVLMQGRKVEGEEEIIAKAREAAHKLLNM